MADLEVAAPVEAEVEKVEVEPKEEEVKEEKPMEVEEVKPVDAEPDEDASSEARFMDGVKINSNDGTLNVIATENGVVSALDMGLPLIASARANVGILSGRYLFEAEILQLTNQGEVRLGFGLANSSLYLGDEGTMCVTGSASQQSNLIINGSIVQPPAYKRNRLSKGDVIGLFLNRTDVGNAKTVSVFINGARVGEPQAIPDSFDGALFPHVSVHGAVLSVNLTKNLVKELPFKCRPIGDASQKDIRLSEIAALAESEIIVPVGFAKSEWADNYANERPMENITEISEGSVQRWQEKSGMKKCRLTTQVLDTIHKLMAFRKRKFIYTLNHSLLADERKKFVSLFPKQVLKTAILDDAVIESLPKTTAFYKDVELPTEEEGWTTVQFTSDKAKCLDAVTKWQKRCQNATKVENFKASDSVKTKIEEYEKFKTASKKNAIKQKKEREDALKLMNGEEVKEEPKKEENEKEEEKDAVAPSTVNLADFTEEDWMLADIRVELHAVCHAFREDVEDKERTEFSVDFLQYYYSEYATPRGKNFHPSIFGCQHARNVLELISDTVVEEDGMVVPKLSKDATFDDILKLTEDARQERVDRIGAGDESANLKFKARSMMNSKGSGKGNFGGNKGGFASRPQVQPYGNKGSYNSGGYSMRNIPQNNKRVQPGGMNFQSQPKRFR